MYNTKTKIVEESIHVKFDHKLDSEKSKLVDKFEKLEIAYSNSEDKASGDTQQEAKPSELEVANTSEPLRKFKQRSSHSEYLILV